MPRWGMVIDLRKCIGCATCREVCDQSDERPPGVSRSVIEKGKGSDAQEERFFITMSCMHCEHPLCQDTCPTGATYRRPDGIIEIRENLCIGCGACIVACPYRARSICREDVIRWQEFSDRSAKEEFTTDRIGICTKCNFCSGIIDTGLQKGMKPGEDPEATPLCVRFCIAEALYFGDLDDKESKVSKLIQENKITRLLEEMDTDPSIYYILK
jgi:phenylacetyl-CoA:acceptor oxidoreductase 27-kDa subunit